MREQIIDLENRIAEDKNILNDLSKTVYEGNSYNPNFIKAKLSNMQNDIAYMEKQLDILRRDIEIKDNQVVIHKLQEEKQYEQRVQSQEKKIESQEKIYEQKDKPQKREVPSQSITWNQGTYSIKSPQNSESVELDNKNDDMETKLGKNVMGIAASVLIFISLILFAKLIIPYITDTVRMFFMYAISFGLTAFGLIKSKKSKDNVLFLSISACGIGSIYISLLLTRMYFNVIGDVALYVALLVWAVVVCILSKLRSEIFNIIGQLGIFISICYGVNYCVNDMDINKFAFLVGYYLIGSLIFYLSHSRNKANNIINSIYNIISIFAIYVGIEDISWQYSRLGDVPQLCVVISILMLLYTIINLAVPFLWRCVEVEEKKSTPFKEYTNGTVIFSIGYYFLFSVFVYDIFAIDISHIIIFVTSLMFIVMVECLSYNNEKICISILELIHTAVMVIVIGNIGLIHKSVDWAIIIIPYLIYGYMRNRPFFKYTAIALLALFIFNQSIAFEIHTILGFLIILLAFAFVFTKKEQYNLFIKNVLYTILMIFIVLVMCKASFEYMIESYYVNCTMFVIISLLTAIALKSRFSKNPVDGEVEKTTKNYLSLIIAILMIIGLEAISNSDKIICYIIYCIVTVALFILNTPDQVRNKDIKLYGVYVGLKFTILITVILNSINAESFIVSIACFLFAIACVCAGFFVLRKELRMYGLVLALISVIKLIMIDISHYNSLGYALSFLISGMLCFAISGIYSYAEKKISN